MATTYSAAMYADDELNILRCVSLTFVFIIYNLLVYIVSW